MKTQKSWFARIVAAFFNSRNGLIAALKGEVAFQQEVFLFIISLPLLYLLPLSLPVKLLLLFANTNILIVELLNSAVEAVVDLASPEYHALAKKAKDLGSAAVFISIVLAFILWCVSCIPLVL